MPVVWSYVPSTHLSSADGLRPNCVCWVHCPAARQTLVQVLVVKAERIGNFTAPCWVNFHATHYSVTLHFVQALRYFVCLALCLNRAMPSSDLPPDPLVDALSALCDSVGLDGPPRAGFFPLRN